MRMIDGDKLTENAFKNPISYNAFCNLVKRQPTVDAVPVRHGRWKAVTDDGYEYKRICSCCGKEAPYDARDEDPLSEGYYMLYPYCPGCGRKLVDECAMPASAAAADRGVARGENGG